MSTTAAVDEKEVRARLEPEIRKSVTEEIEGRAKEQRDNRARLRTEIRAIRDQHVKDSGDRWSGEKGKVVIVSDEVRKITDEFLAEMEKDSTSVRSDSEIRMDYKEKVAGVVRNSRPPKPQTEAANLPDELASRCSLGRILRNAAKDVKGRSASWMPSDGAEFEADKEIRNRQLDFPLAAGLTLEGIQLPMNMPSGVRSTTRLGGAIPEARNLAGPRYQRDAFAGDFATGGALIAPQYVWPTIELLRNLPALSRAGMTVLGGVMGPVILPRQVAATIPQSLGEGVALTQYDQAFDQIRLDPHRAGSSQNYSRLLLLQADSSPDIEAIIMADHMAVIALYIDTMGLTGQGGGNQPLGVLNQLIPTVAFASSAANAFKNAVLMQTNVRKTNIMEAGSYITTSVGRGSLMSTAKLLTGATTVVATPVWENETVAGHAGWDSQQVPGDVIVYGVWKHLVMAQWGGLAVVLDTITRASQDEYRLSINTYIDFALRHNSAICRSVDSIASLS